jgi:hypothetical protein
MKTILPKDITTIDEAKKLLTELYVNGESYHCEDDATDIEIFTFNEGANLNRLMDRIYSLALIDPCEYLLYLGEITVDNYNEELGRAVMLAKTQHELNLVCYTFKNCLYHYLFKVS